jgi:iron complex outermembrane receptor protein
MQRFKLRASLMAAVSLVAIAPVAVAQVDDSRELRAEEIVITGTRVANRSALDTVAPVDVVSQEDLTQLGSTELNQALAVNVPSFNFPRPGLADGTDTIRPATLRGLAPDQTLVLVNSKRRHAASLVNVNGTVGRGSSAVDLNTIPSASIQSIEILRDGASAQYGSDAIAGVMNVRLREAREGANVTVSYGWRETEYTVPVQTVSNSGNTSVVTPLIPSRYPTGQATRERSDGHTATVSAWVGLPLTETGFLTLSGEFKTQNPTQRGGVDVRQQYALVNGALDPREATIDRFNAWYGEPEVDQFTLFANAGHELNNGVSLYGWASTQFREALSAGFFRRPQDARNVIEIHPNGFLPLIQPDVLDTSAAGGARWNWGPWAMDSSLVYGSNRMEFTIRQTVNRSFGANSTTQFDAGGFEADQLTFNFGGVRTIDAGLASPVNLAVGVEARRETYEIFAGEPASYQTGPAGGAGGAQVFPGFQPSNEVSEDRTAVGAYVDAEVNLTPKFLVAGALRAEDYSDFGQNLSAKLAGRYDFADWFAVRGSAQTGFRAPSLQQRFFTATSTNFINGVPFEIGTFPSEGAIGRALGGQELTAEESVNLSLGAVLRVADFTLTVDGYRINIDDRIVLSENITGAAAEAELRARGITNANGGRYFLNGVDSETTGVDVIANWGFEIPEYGEFNATLGANFNETEVTRAPTPFVTSTGTSFVRFGRVNILTFEEGTPKDKYTFNLDWKKDKFGATFRTTRYGEVLSPGTTAASDLRLTAKFLFDVEGRYQITDRASLAIGADNVFDEYPDPSPVGAAGQPNLNSTGNTPFSNYSPFGRSGRYVYGRLSFNF